MPTPPSAPSRSDLAARIAAAVAGVAREGYAVVPDFLPPEEVTGLRGDCLALWEAGRFAPAGIGRGGQRQRNGAIRGDAVLWLDEAPQSAPLQRYATALEALRLAINERLMLGVFELEAHFAVYPAGTGYRRHLDRFRDSDLRTLTCVLYLNEAWQPEDGGQLRLYLDGAADAPYLEVIPAAGTLACFLSADFPHEVLPARRERLALTGWLRRRG
jgi:SM-20-related protein